MKDQTEQVAKRAAEVKAERAKQKAQMDGNQPYVKKFDAQGNVTNPIDKMYLSPFENRHMRRSKPAREMNNRNTYHLNVVKTAKFKVVQMLDFCFASPNKDRAKPIVRYFRR